MWLLIAKKNSSMRKYNVVALESTFPQKYDDLNLKTDTNKWFHTALVHSGSYNKISQIE